MAIITPDYLQTKTYAAKRDRRVNQALVMQEGIVNAGDFKVTQRGAGANMSVDVAAGESWVDGDSSIDQGFYHVVNDATVNVAIANNSSGNPRIDTLVLKVNDSADAGSGTDTPALEIVQGIPTAAATLSNLNGIAALPATALRLAYILVANGAVKIENASIGNLADPRRGTTGYPAVVEPKAVAGAPTQYAHGRPLGYVPMVKALRSAVQSIANNETKLIEMTTADEWDPDEMHSNVSETTRIFCRTPGIYLVSLAVGWQTAPASITDTRGTWRRVNGADDFTEQQNAVGSSQQIAYQVRLAYNDFVEFPVVHHFGSAINANGRAEVVWQGP
jgi:hypothetical protein